VAINEDGVSLRPLIPHRRRRPSKQHSTPQTSEHVIFSVHVLLLVYIFANHDVHSSLWQIIRSTLQQAAINNNTMDDFLNDELKRGKRSGIEITHTIGKQCRLARIAIRLPTSRRRPHDR
jgi:hypothetical protein